MDLHVTHGALSSGGQGPPCSLAVYTVESFATVGYARGL